MKKKRMRVAALAACLLVMLAGSAVGSLARVRQGTFYNPNIYNNTRRTMSNRAAMRAALRKKRAKRAARARRLAARRANVR
ncbi:MAG TPA: hypothetical protein VF570_19245 [Pyrinomonadaceae bacterium]|jgi:hypothetical protein